MPLATTGLAALFFLPFLVPIHTAPLPAFYAEWLAASLGLIAVLGLLRNTHAIEIPYVALLPIGLAALLLLDMGTHPNIDHSGHILALLYLSLSFVVMLATSALSNSMGRYGLAIILGWAALAGGIVNALIAIIQHWNIDTPLNSLVAAQLSVRGYGNLAQSNHFATQLAIALGALTMLFTMRRINWPFGVAMATILMIGLSLSGSRSGWLYLIATIVLAILYRHQSGSEQSHRFLWFALGALVLFSALQMFFATIVTANPSPSGTHTDITTAMARLASSPEPFEVRATLWRNALRMFLEAPTFGVGYQGYSWNFFLIESTSPSPLYRLDENHVWSNCHNLPLQLLAELGIGAGALLMGFGYWLFRTYRRIQSTEHCGVLVMLAVTLVHSLIEYPLYYLYFLLPFSVLTVLASEEVWHVQISQIALRLGTVGMLAVGGVVLVLTQSDYRVIEAIHTQTGKKVGTLNIDQLAKLAALQQSSLLSDQADELINQLAVSLEKPATWQPLLAVSKRVMLRNTAAAYVFRHIYLLTLTGRHNEAIALLTKARHVFPYAYRDFNAHISRMSNQASESLQIRALASDSNLNTP